MEEIKIKITIIATVKSNKYPNPISDEGDRDAIIDDISCESEYEIPSTDDVDVINTEMINVEIV